MRQVLAALVAATFGLGSLSVLAASAPQKTEMTQEEKAELRQRADRMKTARAEAPAPAAAAPHATKAKATKVKKARKGHTNRAKRDVKHAS
jgi:hypothetical protein